VDLSQAEGQSESAYIGMSNDARNLRDRMKVLGEKAYTAVMRCKLIDPAMPQNVSIVETPENIEHSLRSSSQIRAWRVQRARSTGTAAQIGS
jgi:hypothetical protein